MSLKKLLLSKSDSNSSEILKPTVANKERKQIQNVLLHLKRSNSKKGGQQLEETKIIKVVKETAVPYEEYLNILHKPCIFIITFTANSNIRKGQCPSLKSTTSSAGSNKLKYGHFELANLSGEILLKGKFAPEHVRIFDNRNRLFMMLTYQKVQGQGQRPSFGRSQEASLSVPNSSIQLATLRNLPCYVPFNKRFQMSSQNFPELNFNVEHQSLPNRYSGNLFKYTMTNGRKIVAKFLQPSAIDQMYVLVEENVSVFQKTGILATAIFIGQRSQRSIGKYLCVGLTFFLVFLFGFIIVGSTVFNIRYKNPDYNHSAKFPNKLKAPV